MEGTKTAPTTKAPKAAKTSLKMQVNIPNEVIKPIKHKLLEESDGFVTKHSVRKFIQDRVNMMLESEFGIKIENEIEEETADQPAEVATKVGKQKAS